MLLRTFSPTDLGEIMRMVAGTFSQDYPPSMYLSLHAYWPDGFLVAADGGKITGFLLASLTEPVEARILIMMASESSRGKGIGTALLNEFTARCGMKGVKRIVLEVRASNAHAIQFYTNRGFQKETLLEKYYLDGEDGVKMSKWL